MTVKVKIISALIGGVCIAPTISGLPSAQAAALTPITVTCSGGPTGFLQFTSVTGAAENDTILVTNNAGRDVTFTVTEGTGYTLSPSSPVTVTNGNTTTITVGSSSTGRIQLTTAGGGDCAARTQTLVIRYSAPPGPSPSTPTTTNAGPTPIIQQFGKPATGTCDVGAPEMLNIGGAESGGWSESWAEWMNGRTGGFVCTRTLVYSNALGRWVVG